MRPRDLTESIKSTPIRTEKTVRRNTLRCLTSANAGKIIPLSYIPLLREDRVATSRVNVNIEMMETVETLMNPIAVRVKAVFVPFLAFDRFEGSLDRFNRSFKGQPDKEGGAVVPFFETMAYDRNSPIFNTMGIHAKQGAQINASVVEAYNAWVNYRRKQISTKLPLRTALDTSLAAAEWANPNFRNIVPDFDQAAIDGEVELNIVNPRVPIMGVGTQANGQATVKPGGSIRSSSGSDVSVSNYLPSITDAGDPNIFLASSSDGFPQVFAELQANGMKLSLANIEMAKRTAAFAQLRKDFAGLDDDHIIDLLMEGIRVPDAQMSQPILLDRKTTMIGFSRRFATDGASLEKSVTTGATSVSLTMRTPPMNTGGVILIVAEVVPENLFERQKDYFLHTTDPETLPNFLRDYLDPEKVSIVQNSHVDVEHSSPDGTFGYAPLNHYWNRSIPNIGGKYFRQLGDPFDENRQKIWSVETVDPALTSDWYLVNNLHQKVFADQTAEPFEIITTGDCSIIGNTVFGRMLEENTGDFDAISEDVDQGRIDQDAE